MIYHTPHKWSLALAFLLLSLISVKVEAQAQQNVSFSSVLEQPSTPPSALFFYGDDANQKIAYWSARDSKADIVFIHGGCWLSAYDMTHSDAMTTALNKADFDVYSLEYRRTGDTGGGWPTTFGDIQRAFAEVLARRDPQRPLFIMGHSAGGHLALLLASQHVYQRHIDAVIGLAAITDIDDYARGSNSCERVTVDFMGGTPQQRPEAYQLANPGVFAPHPNTWLLHGSADAIVAPRYAEKLPRANIIMVPEAGHFDWVHPQTDAFKRLLKTLEPLVND